MKYLSIILLCLLFFGSCSHIPKNYVPEGNLKKEANRLIKQAQYNELQNNRDLAKHFYECSYQKFTLIDDIEGKLNCLFGLARQDFYLGNKITADEHIKQAYLMINSAEPSMMIDYYLYKIETAFYEDKYDSVLVYTEKISNQESEVATQILCYKLIIKRRMETVNSDDLSNLISATESLERKYKNNELKDQSAISFCYYTIGYLQSGFANFKQASKWYKKALSADQDNENTSGIALDLEALGYINDQLKAYDFASTYYTRSAEIYQLLNQPELAKENNIRSLFMTYKLKKNRSDRDLLLQQLNEITDPTLKKRISDEILKG